MSEENKALEAARRLIESAPTVSEVDCITVACFAIKAAEALEKIKSQANNLPRSATADTICNLADAALKGD